MKICDAHSHIDLSALKDLFAAKCVQKKCAFAFYKSQDWETLFDFLKSVNFSAIDSGCKFLLGYHPKFLDSNSNFALLEKLLQSGKFYMGEIGLDNFCGTPKNLQEEVFARQLEIASKLNLSVSLHVVKAHQKCLQILKNFKTLPKILLHAASCSPEEAAEYAKLGASFSLGLRELKSKHGKQLASSVPLKKILLESDKQDLLSIQILEVYREFFTFRKESENEICETLDQNFYEFFL